MTTTETQRAAASAPEPVLSQPHRRFNPLTDEWVLVSTERTQRPWQGRQEAPPAEQRPSYDPTCYLCPGNTRAKGNANPVYEGTYVFTNDYSALRPDTSRTSLVDGMLRAEGEPGTCRVLCYSPRHDLALAQLPTEEVRSVIDVWADQTAELGERYRWVQVFENRGEAMGASNPHPHGQIWAGTALPREAAREEASQRRYHQETGRRLLCDYAEQEQDGPRVVASNPDWLVVVPFWAAWPFETLLLPRMAVSRLPELGDTQRDSLAAILIELVRRYDALFQRPFPYSMGWHQAPFDEVDDASAWQLHAHAYPPLLGGDVRKFMVGYELLAETQRDLSAEDAAARLRGVAIG